MPEWINRLLAMFAGFLIGRNFDRYNLPPKVLADSKGVIGPSSCNRYRLPK